MDNPDSRRMTEKRVEHDEHGRGTITKECTDQNGFVWAYYVQYDDEATERFMNNPGDAIEKRINGNA